jgi:hypothetical protein
MMKDQPTATLRIANFPNDTTELEIRALFAPYSMIKRVRLVPGTLVSRSWGFGFVDIRPDDVASTVAALDGSVFRGVAIRVDADARGHTRAAIAHQHAGEAAFRGVTASPDTSPRFHYELAMVERAGMPARGQGTDWYRYVLLCGSARITGLRHGTLEEVAGYAEGCAAAFNFRGTNGRSRNPVVLGKK